VVVLSVHPDSEASRRGLQVGAILLRYQGACLHEGNELHLAMNASELQPEVILTLGQAGAPVELYLPGGDLGIAAESF
jgi:hypothetical protein